MLASTVSLLLQFISLELIEQADSPALLPQVQQNASAFFGDHPHGLMELLSAVTAAGAEHVSGQTLRVDAA